MARWISTGSNPVTMAAPITTATTAAATRATCGQPGSRRGAGGSATVGLWRDPDRSDEDLARMGGAAPSAKSGLGTMERDGQIGPDGRVGWFAAGKVDCGGGVDGHDRDAGTVRALDDLDGGPDRLTQWTPH